MTVATPQSTPSSSCRGDAGISHHSMHSGGDDSSLGGPHPPSFFIEGDTSNEIGGGSCAIE
ncbi:hypothetical protein HGRIS_011995 [Hohenbuehelia grisea]|uniref:Uncharacterized protein n=1 Tax=Hohenbuehelia grisea TaxID=104357 RepID=A0ABR3JZ35_9AGAR